MTCLAQKEGERTNARNQPRQGRGWRLVHLFIRRVFFRFRECLSAGNFRR
jgi:hypothetical protein